MRFCSSSGGREIRTFLSVSSFIPCIVAPRACDLKNKSKEELQKVAKELETEFPKTKEKLKQLESK